MLSVNFFGLSDGVLYNAQLRRLPYHKHAVFYGDRNGIYGDIELLDEAAQMAKDIEVGLMIQEHRVIQEFRSLAETSRDDPEQQARFESMAEEAARIFYSGYEVDQMTQLSGRNRVQDS